MSLVANEQAKLTATYLNGVAIATIAVGGLAPIVAFVGGTAPALSSTAMMGLTSVCLVISVTLHISARRHLTRLRP